MKRRRKFHPVTNPKKCQITKKTMFKTQGQAGRAMMRVISHDPGADMFDLHTYFCGDCKHWHFGHRKWFEMAQKVSDSLVSAV